MSVSLQTYSLWFVEGKAGRRLVNPISHGFSAYKATKDRASGGTMLHEVKTIIQTTLCYVMTLLHCRCWYHRSCVKLAFTLSQLSVNFIHQSLIACKNNEKFSKAFYGSRGSGAKWTGAAECNGKKNLQLEINESTRKAKRWSAFI